EGKADVEAYTTTKSGKRIPLYLMAALIEIEDEQGEAKQCIIGTGIDITARRQAEEKLKEAQRHVENLINSSIDMIIAVDGERCIVEANKAAQETFGYGAGELLGSHADILYYTPEESAKVHDTLAETGRFVGEVTNKRKNGELFTSLLSASVLTDKDGTPIGFVGISRDITERQRMEEELLRARRMESVGILAGGIAHDFNNLLTTMLGNISLAKLHISPGSETFEYLDKAENSSVRARDLIKQLITFSRGSMSDKKVIRLGELVADIVPFALRDSRAEAEIDMPGDLWPIEVDAGQIRQAINNMLINARDSMPEGGTIRISAANFTPDKGNALPLRAGKYLKISIQDHGVGIPEQHLPAIFDPYFSTKGMWTQAGLGLGLAVSYSIVKSHRGLITVDSKEGVGTTFHIYLPAFTGA
ncbi:MAG TPA: PAS domain S-box protein, partial [Dissulfurispiraceae bacterium]